MTEISVSLRVVVATAAFIAHLAAIAAIAISLRNLNRLINWERNRADENLANWLAESTAHSMTRWENYALRRQLDEMKAKLHERN